MEDISTNTSMKKKYNTLLKITKIVFLSFMIIFTSLFVLLFIYSRTLDYYIPEFTQIEIYDKDNNLVRKTSSISNNTYVNINEISENVKKAIIAIEDKEFYNHQGINLKRMIAAIMIDIKAGEYVQGGSTITQQYVKTLFLNSEQTWKRKINEAMIAVKFESIYSKDEILEGYLNAIYFDHGIYGVEDASLYYFVLKKVITIQS